MKRLQIYFLISFLLTAGTTVCSQNSITKINKNINRDASELMHNLNEAADSIFLTSNNNILRVSFLSHEAKDNMQINIDNTKEVKIPLYHFKEGRYTVAVFTADKIIAFDFNRLEPIVKPNGAIDDLEESILRGSLSEEEQIARNMTPTKKSSPSEAIAKIEKSKPKFVRPKVFNKEKKKDTRVAKVNSSKPKVKVTKKNKDTHVAKVNTSKSKIKVKENKIEKRTATVNKPKVKVVVEREKLDPEKQIAVREKPTKPQILGERPKTLTKSKPRGNSKKTTIGEKREVKYNISDFNDESVNKQSRDEYRSENLRPNGKKYD